jgi:hypothetical protein
MVISRDVKFKEEGTWDWKVDDGWKYNFLPILEEKKWKIWRSLRTIVTPL